MRKPRICAVITENDYQAAAGVKRFVDYYEVRLDLIGDGWQTWVKKLNRPWIATNRLPEEGGKWVGGETDRIAKIYEAVKLGARIVDIELRTDGLADIIGQIRRKKVRCLISVHNFKDTPDIEELKAIIRREIAVGADICKVATAARRLEDNMTILSLFSQFPGIKLVAMAMGQFGVSSRVLSPLLGGYFTYASLTEGKESAAGQLTAAYLRSFYEATGRDKN
ncbi:MAG: type I 3-dehydroquinate dehydratase [Dehalococcoidales bacterium]|nr:type I 3-dehydroquinate dehydratase [Dehalococcoidales bacterium]